VLNANPILAPDVGISNWEDMRLYKSGKASVSQAQAGKRMDELLHRSETQLNRKISSLGIIRVPCKMMQRSQQFRQ
jgi:hypothetical protein